ncbi:hypothetical protein V6N13_053274 [Hibiscus sabdariffa]
MHSCFTGSRNVVGLVLNGVPNVTFTNEHQSSSVVAEAATSSSQSSPGQYHNGVDVVAPLTVDTSEPVVSVSESIVAGSFDSNGQVGDSPFPGGISGSDLQVEHVGEEVP